MRLATYISALRKAERLLGWCDKWYDVPPGTLSGKKHQTRTERQADKFAARIQKMYDKREAQFTRRGMLAYLNGFEDGLESQ